MEFDSNLLLKLISIPSLFLLCFIFGILPYAIEKCRMNESFLSYANTFSGGLFFGIGQFHLLPESVEKLSKFSPLPLAYFLAVIGYSFILFIQKVVFGNIVPSAEQNLQSFPRIPSNDKICGLLNESEDSDFEKSYDKDNTRFSSISKGGDNADNSDNNIDSSNKSKRQVDLIDDKQQKSKNTNINQSIRSISEEISIRKRKLSAFIMLLSLSIHGLFECLALGIQTNYKNTLFLFIALMIHKWAEAFAIGILFVKAKFAKKFYYLIILVFALIGPVGVAIGIVLSATANDIIEGIFLSISTGTFLYVACSEVIIEEFSEPEKRYCKFSLYLIGCIFAAGLTLLEYYME